MKTVVVMQKMMKMRAMKMRSMKMSLGERSSWCQKMRMTKTKTMARPPARRRAQDAGRCPILAHPLRCCYVPSTSTAMAIYPPTVTHHQEYRIYAPTRTIHLSISSRFPSLPPRPPRPSGRPRPRQSPRHRPTPSCRPLLRPRRQQRRALAGSRPKLSFKFGFTRQQSQPCHKQEQTAPGPSG